MFSQLKDLKELTGTTKSQSFKQKDKNENSN